MKLIKPSFTLKEQEPGLDGIYKQIEWAGRHCYKSLDKITENSAKEFVDRMIKSGHYAVLEHGTVYLKVPLEEAFNMLGELWITRYLHNPYTKTNLFNDTYYITTNYRVLIENKWLQDLEFMCDETNYHEKRPCVEFICDRGVSHEFVRHKLLCAA